MKLNIFKESTKTIRAFTALPSLCPIPVIFLCFVTFYYELCVVVCVWCSSDQRLDTHD